MGHQPELIGRDRETSAIDIMLARAASGHRSAVLIQAKPGLGASALLTIAVARARLQHFRVLLAAAHEFEIHWPFATIAELLDLRVGDPDPQRARLQSDLIQEIATGPQEPNEPAFAKRMVDALLGFEGPTLVAIDDVHFADDQSIATLNRALRRGRDKPLAVVLTCREGESRQRVRRLWESLRGEGTAVLRLAPLTANEVHALAEATLGAPPTPQVARRLSGAGGFPLWVVEFAEQAKPPTSDAEWTADELSKDFRDYVMSRTSALGSIARAVLEWLSVANEASTHLLAQLVAQDPDEVAHALGECALSGLVSEQGDSWTFTQGLVRDALYSALSEPTRVERHAVVARSLDADSVATERIAEQWLSAAVIPSRDVMEKIREIARGWTGTAPFQALRLLRRADEIAEGLGLPRVEILTEKTIAALNAGAGSDATWSAQALLDLPEARDQHPRARVLLTRALLLARRYDDAARTIEGTTAEEPLELALAAVANAWSFDLRKTEECLARFDTLPATGAEAALNANAARASSLYLQGRVQEAAALASETFLDAEGVGAEHSRLRWMFCEMLAFADRQQESQRLLALEESRATSTTPSVAPGLVFVSALNRYLLGNWDGLADDLASAPAIDPDRDSDWIEPDIKGLHALLALHRDEIDLAERLTADLIKSGVSSDHYLGLGVIVLQLRLPSNRDRIPALMARAGEELALGRSQGIQNLYWQECFPLVRSAVEIGDLKVAQLCVEIAEDVAALNDLPSATAIAIMCRAVLETDPTLATEAVGIVEHSPRPLLQAAINESGGAVLVDTDRRAATDRYVAALRIFDRLGADRDAARVMSYLRPLGVTRQKLALSEPEGEGWETLTPGEWRVVKLAARGHTTPAIAERLFLSPRTVQTHLRSSFRKLGVSTRAELAALVSQRLLSDETPAARE